MSSRRSFCSNLVGQATEGCLDAPTRRTALSESAPLDSWGTSDAARTESPAGWCTLLLYHDRHLPHNTPGQSAGISGSQQLSGIGSWDSSRVFRFDDWSDDRATARRRYGCTSRILCHEIDVVSASGASAPRMQQDASLGHGVPEPHRSSCRYEHSFKANSI
jgi:hypothetical protein